MWRRICGSSATRWNDPPAFTAVSGWGQVVLGATRWRRQCSQRAKFHAFGWLQVWLAEGAAGGRRRIAGLHMEGEPARAAAVFRAGAESRAGTGSAAGGRSVSDIPAVSRRTAIGSACDVAAAVWSGHHDRRGVFGVDRARDGAVFHAAGRAGGARSGELGKLVSGGGIWRAAHCFWIVDREEARWVGRFHRSGNHANSGVAAAGAGRGSRRAPRAPELPELDRLIHERIRLGIVSALATNDSLSFNDLKRVLKTTDGNLERACAQAGRGGIHFVREIL